MFSKIVIGFLILIASTSCDLLMDEWLPRNQPCPLNGARLENKSLRTGTVGSNYYESISANVNATTYDEDYYYKFYFKGVLQKGLNYYSEGRKFIINGVPEEEGVITFQLSVEVVLEKDDFGTCGESMNYTYTLTVN